MDEILVIDLEVFLLSSGQVSTAVGVLTKDASI